MISHALAGKLMQQLKMMRQWKQKPCLHHGDLRLKNVMADQKGRITAIIDWENCISAIGPGWDTSIALHDLSIDAQWRYLEGYGMTENAIRNVSGNKGF